MLLGISSCWRSGQIRDGRALVESLSQFDGISALELDYRILEDAASYIATAVQQGKAKICSVHNYCPVPPGLGPEQAGGDVFLLSSPQPEQRELALAHTRKTIELAADLGAGAVVLHLGRVEVEEPMEQIKRLYDQGNHAEDASRALVQRFMDMREARKSLYLEAVKRNLAELLPLADRLNVLLGLEVRYYLREIPSFEEMAILLEEFRGGPVGYWHDVGHASVQGNLGIRPSLDWLEAYRRELIGVHIHDTRGHEDHLAPGEGNTDFNALRPYLGPSVLKVLEVRDSVGPGAVRAGIELIARSFQPQGITETSR